MLDAGRAQRVPRHRESVRDARAAAELRPRALREDRVPVRIRHGDEERNELAQRGRRRVRRQQLVRGVGDALWPSSSPWPRASRPHGRARRADRSGGQTPGGAVRRAGLDAASPAGRRSPGHEARRLASARGLPAVATGRWMRTWSSSTRCPCWTSSWPTRCWTPVRTAPICCSSATRPSCPSIGPGRVLGDVIDSGIAPVTRAPHAVPTGGGWGDRPAGDERSGRDPATGR